MPPDLLGPLVSVDFGILARCRPSYTTGVRVSTRTDGKATMHRVSG
ncbi:hypothetical protein ACFV2N_09995 [Streptomyces sp. NPDC059680]